MLLSDKGIAMLPPMTKRFFRRGHGSLKEDAVQSLFCDGFENGTVIHSHQRIGTITWAICSTGRQHGEIIYIALTKKNNIRIPSRVAESIQHTVVLQGCKMYYISFHHWLRTHASPENAVCPCSMFLGLQREQPKKITRTYRNQSIVALRTLKLETPLHFIQATVGTWLLAQYIAEVNVEVRPVVPNHDVARMTVTEVQAKRPVRL